MNKKFWIAFLVVTVVMILTNFAIHVGLLGGIYRSPEMSSMMRPEAEQQTWIHIVTSIIASFFFTLIYIKGYEGKGIGEGVRFGFYVGMLMAIPMAYDTYAAMAIPYSLALQWFIYGLVQYIILGIVAAAMVGKKSAPAA